MSGAFERPSGRPLQDGEVVWTRQAMERVERAPEFVRAGIRKLMQKRARELGQPVITSGFLTQIRDEAMLRVTKSMRKFGFEELRMEAFEVAKAKMSRNLRRGEVIGEIERFLARRTSKNEEILQKFKAYFQNLPMRGIPWTPEVQRRLDELPPSVAPAVARVLEEQARRRKEQVVSPQLLDAVLKDVLSRERTKSPKGGESSFGPGEAPFPAHSRQGPPPLGLQWAEEALQRLHRIPFRFAQNLIVQRAEARAKNLGVSEVTLEIYLQTAHRPRLRSEGGK